MKSSKSFSREEAQKAQRNLFLRLLRFFAAKSLIVLSGNWIFLLVTRIFVPRLKEPPFGCGNCCRRFSG
jgi:hypothetical protein